MSNFWVYIFIMLLSISSIESIVMQLRELDLPRDEDIAISQMERIKFTIICDNYF